MSPRLRPRTREQAHTLWSFVGTALAVVACYIGLGYAVDGDRSANSPSFDVLKSLVPGSMHTDGVVLLLLSASMAYAVLTPFDRRTKWVLRVFSFYSFLVMLSFVGSWVTTGEVVWGGPAAWVLIGSLAQGMVIFPPDSLPIKEVHQNAPLDPASRRLQQ